MIRILEKNVADKIAAGEVIDRPVSIIKELLENSIDAGASSITVEIKNGGKSYIRVSDNGSGIDADDMETAFMRHATSKIESVTDLESIGTLGFRGEALASICAVSRVELISKTADVKMGRKVVTEGSEILLNEGIGCPEGTTITVRDLFFNVPARQKFMSSDNAEARRIIDMVSRIALAYGDIKFTLINGSSKVFTTQGKGSIFNSIVSVYGKDIGKDLIPVESRRGEFILKGFVSSPASSAASRSRQIFSVNGRIISSKVMEKALDEAYREKLFHGRFPIAFLFLYISPEKLDVNIHPTKKEIRFEDAFEVQDFVAQAVRNVLSTKDALPKVYASSASGANSANESETGETTLTRTQKQEKKDGGEQVDIKTLLTTLRESKEISQDSQVHEPQPFKYEGISSNVENPDFEADKTNMGSSEKQEFSLEEPDFKPFDFSELKFLGSIFNTYIMAVDESDFYLIDQHAAHERVFYEKLVKQYDSSEKMSQQLMIPLNFNVASHIPQTEDDWIKSIRKMGYDIEYFGNKTYIVREIPAFMELKEAEDFLSDIFKELEDRPDFSNHRILDKIIMRSCKSAVKGGDYLTKDEIDALVKDMKNCINPFSCPHGRPTFIRMTKYEIEKMFKRV